MLYFSLGLLDSNADLGVRCKVDTAGLYPAHRTVLAQSSPWERHIWRAVEGMTERLLHVASHVASVATASAESGNGK